MHITLVHENTLPALLYGGTERVVWYLGKELVQMGHRVTFLAKKGTVCPWAEVVQIDETKPIHVQVPKGTDIVHFSSVVPLPRDFAALFTMHGNPGQHEQLPLNTVFVSRNHAHRYGSEHFVYNGLDWADYGDPGLDHDRNHFHFLGKAAWRVKNVQGAIDLIKKTKSERLHVLGGHRLNLSMGFRCTLSPRVRFFGMVGGETKHQDLRGSKGLIFPVLWHEPFGLAIIESLYFGAPVFGTPYGSLPELVTEELGFLSNDGNALLGAINEHEKWNRATCHAYARNHFSAAVMATAYLEKYRLVLSGQTLHAQPPQLLEIQTAKFLPWKTPT